MPGTKGLTILDDISNQAVTLNHMKTIIAGMRDFHHYETLLMAIKLAPWQITEVVSGEADGVDAMGERYATESNLPLNLFSADWDTHGKAAGPIRNRRMAENAQALLAIWDGKSRGTKNMIETAQSKGLRVFVYRVDQPQLFDA